MEKKKQRIPNSTFRIPNSLTPDGPASVCGSTGGSPDRILFPPMLFARNALASGPQACILAEKAIAKAKGDKPKIELTPISSSIKLRKGKKSVKIGNSRLSFILAEGVRVGSES
jgi:hypothetical protein